LRKKIQSGVGCRISLVLPGALLRVMAVAASFSFGEVVAALPSILTLLLYFLSRRVPRMVRFFMSFLGSVAAGPFPFATEWSLPWCFEVSHLGSVRDEGISDLTLSFVIV